MQDNHLGPLHINSADRAGPVTGTIFALDSLEKFQPGNFQSAYWDPDWQTEPALPLIWTFYKGFRCKAIGEMSETSPARSAGLCEEALRMFKMSPSPDPEGGAELKLISKFFQTVRRVPN